MNVSPDETLEEMRRLFVRGWTYEEIGEHFGISRQAVQQRLRGRRGRGRKGQNARKPIRPWIVKEREDRGWSQTILADEARRHIPPDVLAKLQEKGVNLSQTEISRIEGSMEDPRQRVNPDFADGIEKALRKPTGWVMYGPQITPQSTKFQELTVDQNQLPSAGEVVMSDRPQPKILRILGEMLENETIRMLSEEERPPLNLNGYRGTIGPGVVAFRVIAEHHPRYDKGEILLCYEEGAQIEDCIGWRCVVELESGQRYVGLVERGASPRLVTIRPRVESSPTLVDKTPIWISPIFETIPTRVMPA